MESKAQKHFLKLYEPVHNSFERFCRARVFGKMEHSDLMNETLLIAFQKMGNLKSEKAFLSFLIGISVRILANQHRKKREQLLPTSDPVDLRDESALTERSAEVYLLYQALSLLPDKQRECLVLFEISGFSIKEIVKMQNVGESAVKQRLKRGREKLREILTFEAVNKTGEVSHG
ncbi:MAG: RNA polymerase sigma factor [Flavobacteriales bacterium]|nr:RNA polymerase sigma factor [Flavobacteriales bacterium]